MFRCAVFLGSAAMRRDFVSLVFLAVGGTGLGLSPLNALNGDREDELPQAFGVPYGALDRTDLGQHRELYAPAEALAAIREGKPLPPGTELVMVLYPLPRDEGGTPLATAGGRRPELSPLAYFVMRKGSTAGARAFSGPSGAWQFQIFGPDKRVVRGAKLADCAACHGKQRDQDFVFTGDRMKAFEGALQAR